MKLPLTSADGRDASARSRGEIATLAALCAIAAVLRLWRLGALGLEVDEGVQGLVVQGWLDSGLPILPSGMMYQRAIPFGALQALAAGTIGVNEFALRLPAALFGVAAVAATFALARAFFDRRVAWVAAIFIALSAWEIELSRYARFYTAFQVTCVLALLCFFRALDPGGRAWRWGFAATALAAITFHELSIVLATFFLIPLFDRTATPRLRGIALASLVLFLAIWFAYRRGFVRWFVGLAPPHGLELLASGEPVDATGLVTVLPGFPALRFPGMSAFPTDAPLVWLALALSLIVALGATAWSLRRTAASEWWRGTLLVVALALGVVHQFLLAAFVLVVHLALSASTVTTLWSRQLRPVVLALTIMLGIWIPVVASLTRDVKTVTLSLAGFPNVLQHFVYWFALGWPLFLVAVTAVAVIMFERFLRNGERAMLFLLAGIVGPLMIASMFDSYFESRYVFHLYPLLAILFAWGLLQFADRLSSFTRRGAGAGIRGTVLAAGFLVSGDVGPVTWAPMARTHSSHRDPMRSIISWKAFAGLHQDQREPSRFVRERAENADVVAAIGVPHQLAVYRFYLGRLDRALGRPHDLGYQRLRNGRIIDWVTGSELVFDPKDLVTGPSGRATWLVGDEVILGDAADYFPVEVRREALDIVKEWTFRGRDGVSFARKLP